MASIIEKKIIDTHKALEEGILNIKLALDLKHDIRQNISDPTKNILAAAVDAVDSNIIPIPNGIHEIDPLTVVDMSTVPINIKTKTATFATAYGKKYAIDPEYFNYSPTLPTGTTNRDYVGFYKGLMLYKDGNVVCVTDRINTPTTEPIPVLSFPFSGDDTLEFLYNERNFMVHDKTIKTFAVSYDLQTWHQFRYNIDMLDCNVDEYGTLYIIENNTDKTIHILTANDGYRDILQVAMAVAVGTDGSVYSSFDLITWTESFNFAATGTSFSVTYGNNLYVAVGQKGTIVTSPDGITWTKQASGTSVVLYSITYGKTIFVAVGEYGTILSSPDGITWTERKSRADSARFKSVTYGHNLFVAVADYGYIFTSPDGITWTNRTTMITTSFYAIAYGNNLFVAVGKPEDTGHGYTSNICTSPDSITWTDQTSGTSVDLNSITYANNLFVAVGIDSTILTSPDGITWTKQTTQFSFTLQYVTYGNNLFVIVGSTGSILTSPDGITWAQRLLSTEMVTICCISKPLSIAAFYPNMSSINLDNTGINAYSTVTLNAIKPGSVELHIGIYNPKTKTSEWRTQRLPNCRVNGSYYSYPIMKFVNGQYLIYYNDNIYVSDDNITFQLLKIPAFANSTYYIDNVSFGRDMYIISGYCNRDVMVYKSLQHQSTSYELYKASPWNISCYLPCLNEIITIENGSTTASVYSFTKLPPVVDSTKSITFNTYLNQCVMLYNDADILVIKAMASNGVAKDIIVIGVGSSNTYNRVYCKILNTGGWNNTNVPIRITRVGSKLIIYTNTMVYDYDIYRCTSSTLISSVVVPPYTKPDITNSDNNYTDITFCGGIDTVIGANSSFIGLESGELGFSNFSLLNRNTKSEVVPFNNFRGQALFAKNRILNYDKGRMLLKIPSGPNTTLNSSIYSITSFDMSCINCIAYNPDDHYYLALACCTDTTNYCCAKSYDGIHWEILQKDTIFMNFNCIAYAQNTFIISGRNGNTHISTDGKIWTNVFSAGDHLRAITYGNNLFMLVGNGGMVFTSPNTITWTKQTSGTSEMLNSVIYGNNLFVAVGYGGTIVTSPDGITWTKQTSGVIYEAFYSITYGNNLYVAIGGHGNIVTSPDGITWTKQESEVNVTLFSVTYGNSLFVAVGEMGLILTSPDGITWMYKYMIGGRARAQALAYNTNTQYYIGITVESFVVVLYTPTTYNYLSNGQFNDTTSISASEKYTVIDGTFQITNNVINIDFSKTNAFIDDDENDVPTCNRFTPEEVTIYSEYTSTDDIRQSTILRNTDKVVVLDETSLAIDQQTSMAISGGASKRIFCHLTRADAGLTNMGYTYLDSDHLAYDTPSKSSIVNGLGIWARITPTGLTIYNDGTFSGLTLKYIATGRVGGAR